MVRLPPPPRFNLPPPPMVSSDLFDSKFVHLTCSSIRQNRQIFSQIPRSRLIAISSITFLLVFLLFIIILLMIKICRRRKISLDDSETTKPPSTVINPSRSYETISSVHTGIYVESVDTSATTYSTDPSNTVCFHCQQEHEYSSTSLPPPYYHTLDILPS